MISEGKDISGRFDQEEQTDLEWIEQNSSIFWLVATVAFEQTEHGALVVDLTKSGVQGGIPFSYSVQGEIEFQNERLDRLLREYDPQREFVIVLRKPKDCFKVYLGKAPLTGWWDTMETRTHYPGNASIRQIAP